MAGCWAGLAVAVVLWQGAEASGRSPEPWGEAPGRSLPPGHSAALPRPPGSPGSHTARLTAARFLECSIQDQLGLWGDAGGDEVSTEVACGGAAPLKDICIFIGLRNLPGPSRNKGAIGSRGRGCLLGGALSSHL